MSESTPTTDNGEALSRNGETLSRDDAAERAQERLDALFSGGSDDEGIVDDEDDDESPEDDDDSGSDDATEDDDDGADEEAADDEKVDDKIVSKPGTPTLPDSHRRSLKAYGWQDDEIDQNLQVMGDSFLRTAERLHENRNTELQTWAAAGRATRQPPAQQQEQGSQGQAQQPTYEAPRALPPVDVAALKKQYGDDEMVDALAGPVNEAIKALNAMLPQVQRTQEFTQQSQLADLDRKVNEFFGDRSMKGYVDVYGDHTKGLAQEQLDKRMELLDTAYNLQVGARAVHNRDMGLSEAMQLAHEIVAKDSHKAAARKAVVKQAKTRNKGIMQKPTSKSSSDSTSSDGARPNRDQLVKKTEDRLKAVFGR